MAVRADQHLNFLEVDQLNVTNLTVSGITLLDDDTPIGQRNAEPAGQLAYDAATEAYYYSDGAIWIQLSNQAAEVTLASAGAGTSLVADGVGPALSVKSAVAGTGLALATTASTFTYSLTSPVAVANGGTGVTTVPTNGQLPIGNGTGYTVASVTAGTGLTVTPGAGTLQVGLTSPVAVANGGTGVTTTPGNGSLLIGNGTNYTVASLTPGSGINLGLGAGSVTVGLAIPVPVIFGGTGVMTVPANGQLLIGNGVNYTVASVTAGTGLTVTPGAGTLGVGLTTPVAVTSGGTGLAFVPGLNTILVGTGAGYALAALALTSAGAGQSLVVDGSGASLSVASISAGDGVALTVAANNIAISATNTLTTEQLTIAGGETLDADLAESILTTYLTTKPEVSLGAPTLANFQKRVTADNPVVQAIKTNTSRGTFLIGGDYDESALLAYQSGSWQPKQSLCWVTENLQQTITSINDLMSGAISADGNTAAIGEYELGAVGTVNVYTRTAGVWTLQQGPLAITGNVGDPNFGRSLALSADGNTLAAGGWFDNLSVGAVWIFTRSAGVWTQQGAKLVPAAALGGDEFGISVALSADGNTLIGGADGADGAGIGAGGGWVFTRTAGVWTEQATLQPTDAVPNSFAGTSVSISADGNTIALGGPNDDGFIGATWAFVRTTDGTTWVQQGTKIVGTNAAGSRQGTSVALSADGNTLAIGARGLGGLNDGGVFVFNRNSMGAWTQTARLEDPVIDSSNQLGNTVAISGNGRTIYAGERPGGTAHGIWIFVLGNTWKQINTTGPAIPTIIASEGMDAMGISADGRTMLAIGRNEQNVYI